MSAVLIYKSIKRGFDLDKYIITIVGTQTVDDESDTIDVTTSASYTERGGKKYIRYKEYDPNEDGEYISNTIIIESEKKIVLRKLIEDKRTELILDRGVRHQCLYTTPMGYMSIGIYAESIVIDIDKNGGTITIDYTIDFNTDVQSEHHLEIALKKKGET